MRVAGYDLVISDDAVSSGTISTLSTPYTMTPFANWLPNINEGGEKDMMGLYEIDVVDTKKNELIESGIMEIARDETRAKMMAAKTFNLDLNNEYLEFAVRVVKQWESRKPKEVKIVKEE